MSRKIFTKEQQQLLRQNPYIYSVTDTRITLTKTFKEIFMTAYNTGTSPRTILGDHGFYISLSVSIYLNVFPADGKSYCIWSLLTNCNVIFKSCTNHFMDLPLSDHKNFLNSKLPI